MAWFTSGGVNASLAIARRKKKNTLPVSAPAAQAAPSNVVVGNS